MLTSITLTGADERTSIDDLVKLTVDDPNVEIGLLYTCTPEGRPRYPSLQWLSKAVDALGSRCAVHICGSSARKEFLAGHLKDMLAPVARIQVNGNLTGPELVRIFETRIAASDMRPVITQYQGNNIFLLKWLIAGNHELLVDSSGGRGLSPDTWARPVTFKPVGFAGGLGPDNLEIELPKINAVAKGESWVDMEGKLRRDDWFDIGLARECAEVFKGFVQQEKPVEKRRAGCRI